MTSRPHILLVDDDERLRTAAGKVLGAEGYQLTSVGSGQAALDYLRTTEVALLIADLCLPDLDGIALLQQAKQHWPALETVLITGYGTVEKAVAAIKLGAYDFIQKPLDSTALLKVVAKALEKQRLTSENVRLRRQLQQQRGAVALLGDSPPMRGVKDLVRQVAGTDVAVLIQGESGTGKEVVADLLQSLSARQAQPFIKLSCAAIPEALLESELFGHERGAFTGAAAAKPGKFELADGGTLLLDEIAEMSAQLQAKLLRVLQDGRFQRLGSTQERHADVRLLSATHADIPAAITARTFREDLYYRINTVHILLPPLRDRRDDIPLLAGHFLTRFAAEMGKAVPAITPAAMAQLRAHTWPGNVRELEHVIQRAVALTRGEPLAEFAFASLPEQPAPASAGTGVMIPLGTSAEAATRQFVAATIQHCGGNKLKAARLLGMAPRTMYRHFGSRKP